MYYFSLIVPPLSLTHEGTMDVLILQVFGLATPFPSAFPTNQCVIRSSVAFFA